MTFKDGNVSELEASEPPPGEDRVVLTTEHRRQVLDPLSALLMPAGDGGLSEAACRRVLPVFDGRRRYDLSLSFKRIEQVKASQGYAGPTAVCSVAFQPIAGHRRSSPLLTFLTDGRDVEMALAPIAGTRLLAPFRITATYMLGNVVMQATRFEATATPAPTRARSTVAQSRPGSAERQAIYKRSQHVPSARKRLSAQQSTALKSRYRDCACSMTRRKQADHSDSFGTTAEWEDYG
jgi:hypothetical protein